MTTINGNSNVMVQQPAKGEKAMKHTKNIALVGGGLVANRVLSRQTHKLLGYADSMSREEMNELMKKGRTFISRSDCSNPSAKTVELAKKLEKALKYIADKVLKDGDIATSRVLKGIFAGVTLIILGAGAYKAGKINGEN